MWQHQLLETRICNFFDRFHATEGAMSFAYHYVNDSSIFSYQKFAQIDLTNCLSGKKSSPVFWRRIGKKCQHVNRLYVTYLLTPDDYFQATLIFETFLLFPLGGSLLTSVNYCQPLCFQHPRLYDSKKKYAFFYFLLKYTVTQLLLIGHFCLLWFTPI